MNKSIRGRTRAPAQKSININTTIHNRFDIEVVDSITGKIKQRAQAKNIILNKLWTTMFASRTYFAYIHYGSGSGVPAVTDTQLFTFCDAVAVSGRTFSLDPSAHVYSVRQQITLTETVAVGTTITEIGIGETATASTLCTHAMLKDMNGNEISILKTNTDIITIYATVYLHFSGNYNDYFIFGDPSTNRTGIMEWALGVYSSPLVSLNFMGIAGHYTSGTSTTRSLNSVNKTITLTLSRIAAAVDSVYGYYYIDEMYQPLRILVTPRLVSRFNHSRRSYWHRRWQQAKF